MMLIGAGHAGGCQCGAIRYRILRAPKTLYACHCRDCQKQSASAFALSMWMEQSAVAFTGAVPRIYTTRSDSGNLKHCAFCVACGTRLYHTGGEIGGEGEEILSLKAGTLDDPAALRPVCHIWTRRAQPWVARLLEGKRCFKEAPESGEALRALWRAGECGETDVG